MGDLQSGDQQRCDRISRFVTVPRPSMAACVETPAVFPLLTGLQAFQLSTLVSPGTVYEIIFSKRMMPNFLIACRLAEKLSLCKISCRWAK